MLDLVDEGLSDGLNEPTTEANYKPSSQNSICVMHSTVSHEVCIVADFLQQKTAARHDVFVFRRHELGFDWSGWSVTLVAKNRPCGQAYQFWTKEIKDILRGNDFHTIHSSDYFWKSCLPSFNDVAQELCRAAKNHMEIVQLTEKGPIIFEDAEYECVDDFGIADGFSIGCIYVGHPVFMHDNMLELEDNEGRLVLVDKELFTKMRAGR